MQRKDHEALLQRVSRLEKELLDYQDNMGILLIERKEWNLKFDQLRQELSATKEILKREQSSHLIALSEVQKREENLRKALITEKKCGADLERALRAMQQEHALVHSSSKTKLSEANALVDGIEEKSSLVNKKLHDAEYKLAEVNRKSAELDMKLRELEVRESLLCKEQLSVATDRESFEATSHKQREDLKEWEKKLQQREDILCGGRQNLGEREEKMIETEKKLSKRERHLEALEKNINSSMSLLEEKKAEISTRLADLDAKEEEGIEKLLQEQKVMLDLKLQQFELETEERRKSLLQEFRSKEEDLEQREAEINHRQKVVEKEEHGLNKKAERIKEQSKELETKSKSLKEKERGIKVNEKVLEKEKQQLLADVENLQNLKDELDKLKDEISQQKQKICKEIEDLKLTEEERAEHSRLQLELKQEIEHTRLQKDSLMNEVESLREDRLRFEKEWEVLDEKRAEINREKHENDVEKERLRKLHHSEDERLKRERHDMQDHIRNQLDKLELEKESFRESMKQEKLLLSEKLKNEKLQMLQDFEWKTSSLEIEIQKRQDEMEKDLQERERKFQEKMERELNNINVLKDVTEKEWEEVKSQGLRLENERKELESNKQQLKSGQREMHEDSEMLMNLSRKVKNERELLVAERNQFLAFVEKLKCCKECGEVVGGFVVSDLQLPDFKQRAIVPSATSPTLNGMLIKNSQDKVTASNLDSSGSTWTGNWFLRKCRPILGLSSNKRTDGIGSSNEDGTMPLSYVNVATEKVPELESLPIIEGAEVTLEEQQLADGAHHSSETPQPQFERIFRQVDVQNTESMDDHSYRDSFVDEYPDDSQQSVPNRSRGRPGKKSKSGIARTRSVKAVVREANEFLGQASEEIEDASLLSLNADHFKEDSQGDSSQIDKAVGRNGRKRQRSQTSRITESEQNADDSDGQSESITAGGHRKKRQMAASPAQVTGEKRYNLRHPKIVGSTVDFSNRTQGVQKEVASSKPELNKVPEVDPGASLVEAAGNIQSTVHVQVSTTRTLEERVVRFEVPRDIVDDNGAVTNSVDRVEENGATEYEDEGGSTILGVENDIREGEIGEEAAEAEAEAEGGGGRWRKRRRRRSPQ
ncbi:protein CROWDED NUCLEI 3 isoform X2 [Arachis ipaensis]|uniref:protein CROWDED NUCLEI 3 isoform X2 n=1 Tax=Arachis ipaensis TaxID=130454 RepID=UPI000A2B4259|nr:protein CROWDED NUCLEI 3 isoform X2 [Arachis ipaensis]